MTKIQKFSTTMTEPHGVLGPIEPGLIDSNRRSQARMAGPGLFAASGPEEVLVVEERAHLRPHRSWKPSSPGLLQEASFPVSHLQMRGLLSTR